jgi:hypothetical protein
VQCIIIVVVLEGFVEGRQRLQHVEENNPIVIALLGISRGVVYFNHRQVRLIVVCIGRGRDIVERDEGSSGRPTRCQKRAAMLVVWRAFLVWIARL